MSYYVLFLASNLTGALTVDLDGSIEGYFSLPDAAFTINSTAHLSNYRKFAYVFENPCSKILELAPEDGNKLKFEAANNSKRKRRNADEVKYIELIMVVAQSLVLVSHAFNLACAACLLKKQAKRQVFTP